MRWSIVRDMAFSALIVATLSCGGGASQVTCSYDGGSYRAGQSIVDEKSCTACVCDPSGKVYCNLGTCTYRDAGADVPAVVACAPTSGFTSCVHACGETNETESVAATCDAGRYNCPPGTRPAIGCPAESWPSGSFAGCGPWVEGYDCTCRSICDDGLWTCPTCVDGASQ